MLFGGLSFYLDRYMALNKSPDLVHGLAMNEKKVKKDNFFESIFDYWASKS